MTVSIVCFMSSQPGSRISMMQLEKHLYSQNINHIHNNTCNKFKVNILIMLSSDANKYLMRN